MKGSRLYRIINIMTLRWIARNIIQFNHFLFGMVILQKFYFGHVYIYLHLKSNDNHQIYLYQIQYIHALFSLINLLIK